MTARAGKDAQVGRWRGRLLGVELGVELCTSSAGSSGKAGHRVWLCSHVEAAQASGQDGSGERRGRVVRVGAQARACTTRGGQAALS